MRANTPTNLALLAVFLLLVAAHLLVPSDSTQRNFHFMPDMVDSKAHEAQAPPPVVEAGFSVDLLPPAGSVARGYMPEPFEANPTDALRAGVELENPYTNDDSAVIARGASVFTSICSPCHGAGGMGDGSVVSRGVPPPPSLLADHSRGLADGQIYHIITFGQQNMASHASQVERDDRWKLVSYIRSLQESAQVR